MSLTITKADIIGTTPDFGGPAPELQSLPDAVWTRVIAEADAQISVANWGSQARANQGGVYLAAHLAALWKLGSDSAAGGGVGAGTVGPVTMIKVGEVSKSFAAPTGSSGAGTSAEESQFASTRFGVEYLRLRRIFVPRMMVT